MIHSQSQVRLFQEESYWYFIDNLSSSDNTDISPISIGSWLLTISGGQLCLTSSYHRRPSLLICKTWFPYNRYCRKDLLCHLKRAPCVVITTDATEAILAINWFPLSYASYLMVKKTGTSHRSKHSLYVCSCISSPYLPKLSQISQQSWPRRSLWSFCSCNPSKMCYKYNILQCISSMNEEVLLELFAADLEHMQQQRDTSWDMSYCF